jgi:hypothetical protein
MLLKGNYSALKYDFQDIQKDVIFAQEVNKLPYGEIKFK